MFEKLQDKIELLNYKGLIYITLKFKCVTLSVKSMSVTSSRWDGWTNLDSVYIGFTYALIYKLSHFLAERRDISEILN